MSRAILAIEHATDQASAVELLHEAATQMGADVAAFQSFIREDESQASFRYLLACDPQWCVDYEAQAWYADDPWLAYARSHSEPARGRDIVPTTSSQVNVMRLAERFGFCSTVLVPAPSSGGLSRVGLLSLGSETPGYFDDEGFPILKLLARPLANVLQDWLTARLRHELVEGSHLTDEDIVLLRRVSLGHGTKAIASFLGVTEASVNSRSQRLIGKLGVYNRKAAARLVAEYGLI